MACCGALVLLFLVGGPVAVAIHAIIPAISPDAVLGVIAGGLFLLSLTAERSKEREKRLSHMKRPNVALAEQERRRREHAEHRARKAEICARYAPTGIQAAIDPTRTAERMRIPEEVRWRVWQRDGMRCRSCGADSRLTLDHIYPVSLGGTADESNLQTLCRSCNSRKGTRPSVGPYDLMPRPYEVTQQITPSAEEPGSTLVARESRSEDVSMSRETGHSDARRESLDERRTVDAYAEYIRKKREREGRAPPSASP